MKTDIKSGDYYWVFSPGITVLMLARDRVHLLLDPDTPFLELGAFAGYKLDTSSPSASIITGIGVVWYYL
jgi:hypothetical protein